MKHGLVEHHHRSWGNAQVKGYEFSNQPADFTYTGLSWRFGFACRVCSAARSVCVEDKTINASWWQSQTEGGADKSYVRGVKLCKMSKTTGEDTLIHVHGTGCRRGGPLYEEDFACGRRRRNIDQEVLAQWIKSSGGPVGGPASYFMEW